VAVCPSCGTENPDGFKFCGACATPLEQEQQPKAQERKVVSVLFVDLVGFTARSHDADPEDVQATLALYHRRLKTEIERFGGTVEKFIGDAVMAAFGAPVAHEDDTERAVRAALRITEAIEELNEEADLDLSVRAAVNTGEVLVSLTEEMGQGLVGDAVNTASRLQGIAPVGGVVVGEITYRSTKDFIVYEPMEPVALKGKPEPVRVWRAVSARSRFGVDAEVRYKTPFVGREIDLTLLKTTYHRAVRESSLQLVTVVGQPGVGKSRLVAEFYGYIDERPDLITWRQGRSLPYGEGITFWALGEIVKAQAGINESDSAQVAVDKMASAVSAVVDDEGDHAWLQTRLGALVGTSSASGTVEKDESFAAWLRFLEAIASTGPTVFVFEDLHWADASLLEFIEHVVEWSTGVPILIVATARPELYEKHPSWGAGTRNAATISLSPLSDSEIAQLISARLSQAVLPAEIHAAVLDRAGGNPLYAEEFIRMLMDRGFVQQRARTLVVDPDADIPVPDNVHALIAARLDTLSAERKSLLHDAAVVGKVFWSGAVASLGGLDEPSTRRSLQELVRMELIRPARTSSIEAQQEYSFWHGLIRDVSHGQIPRPQRADKHLGVAAWLEDVAGERVADHAEVLAHHYGTAMDLLSASGMRARAAETVEATVHFLVLAAQRAATLNPTTARRLYERGLELMSSQDARRADVLLGLGEVVRFSGETGKAASLAEEAMRLSQVAGDRRTEGKALARLAHDYWWMGRGVEARDLGTEAITVLEQVDPGPELARAYVEASLDATFAGAPAEGLIWADKALAVAERSRSQAEAIGARAARALVLCELGEGEGLDGLRAAYEEAVAFGDGDLIDVIGSNLSNWLWWIENPLSALQVYEESIARSERRGLIAQAMHDRAETLWMRYDVGEWTRLLEEGRQITLYCDKGKDVVTEVAALPYIAQVLAWRQQLEEASALCARFLPHARGIEDLQSVVPALAVSALVAQRRGEQRAAVDLVEELAQATCGSPTWRSRHLPTAVRVLIAAGKVDKAKDVTNGIDVTATRDVNCVLTGQAILAEAHGGNERARDLYHEAAERWADYGFVLEEGQAHLGLARCLIALGDREAATESLQKARAIFSNLGAIPLLKETDGHLHQAEAAS
jgi:class 3 adenylate cyclase/tetratricopeptide (TPR) repeat protein